MVNGCRHWTPSIPAAICYKEKHVITLEKQRRGVLISKPYGIWQTLWKRTVDVGSMDQLYSGGHKPCDGKNDIIESDEIR